MSNAIISGKGLGIYLLIILRNTVRNEQNIIATQSKTFTVDIPTEMATYLEYIKQANLFVNWASKY